MWEVVSKVAIVGFVAGVAWFAEFASTPTAPTTSQEPFSATIALKPAWTTDVLAGLGNESPTANTVAFLEAWHRAEGGTAAFNWLNTTQGAAGATDYNSVGVKNYPNYATGVRATVETLTNGFYPRTLAGLVGNQPTVDDGEMGVWGTGGAAVRAQLDEAQLDEAPHAKCLPTDTGVISAHFSDTNSPYWAAQAGGRHNGTDYAGSQGEPVYAPFALVVEDVQYYGDAGRIGWYVQGRFADGFLFYAGHLGTVAVQVGQAVPACTQIGTIGEVFHSHIKIASPDKPVPCEATGCDDFELYYQEH